MVSGKGSDFYYLDQKCAIWLNVSQSSSRLYYVKRYRKKHLPKSAFSAPFAHFCGLQRQNEAANALGEFLVAI